MFVAVLRSDWDALSKEAIEYADICEDDSSFEIYVKTLSGNSVTLKVSESDTIESVMAQLEQSEGVGVTKQRLVFMGKQLEGDKKVSDYQIAKQAEILLEYDASGNADSIYGFK